MSATHGVDGRALQTLASPFVQRSVDWELVRLDRKDDGAGFDVKARSGRGLGLRSIDERVRLVRGGVTVNSRPGQGTTVIARVPR